MRGWDELDVILFSGDAYVDHPSFGAAVIGRILESQGLKVALIPQPNWRDDLRDFKKLGRPRLFFGVSAGCMDSMVNKYTANKRLRSEDAYTPDGRHDMRPEYPSIVYTRILKRLYPDVPVVVGGIEASLRRLTHYDYWQDKVLPSILADSEADLLIYGMGEKPVEDAKARHGSTRVEGVLFTGPNKLTLATQGKQTFEDRRIRIPLGAQALRSDLHKLQKVSGPTGAPRFVAESDNSGHADRTWALFLAVNAASSPHMDYGYTPAMVREPNGFMRGDDDFDDDTMFTGGAW